MKLRNLIGKTALFGLAFATGLFLAAQADAQYNMGGGGQYSPPTTPSQQMPQGQTNPPQNNNGGNGQAQNGRGRGPAMDPAEENAVKAFNNATDTDAKIQAGEAFNQKFPSSRYSENVNSTLVTLYYDKQDWDKFYGTSDKVLAADPNNVPILTLVGWVIPHAYSANDPSEPAKLDKSQKYEKHALELIPAMQKPAGMTDDQFNTAKAGAAAQAHSGLGLTYFRLKDYDDSAKELQAATTAGTDVDPSDLYILGVDLQNLKRSTDAADAFNRCAQIPGALADRCKQGAADSMKLDPGR